MSEIEPEIEYSLKDRLILSLGFCLIIFITRIIGMTLRVRYVGREHYDRALADRTTSFLMPYWHEHILSAIYLFRRNNIVCMSSRSKDGELVTRVLKHFGYLPSRGSSQRGGREALEEMIATMQKGKSIGSLTVDGPRGPRRVLKDGIVRIAYAVDSVLIPVGFAARSSWRLKSWDRFCIPKPFTRVTVVFGAPMRFYGKEISQLPVSRDEVQKAMDTVYAEAEKS